MKSRFTVPKLATFPIESGERWFVWFRYEGIKNPIKIYKGINKIPNAQERIMFGNELANEFHKQLKNGWNPQCAENLLEKITIHDALNQAILRLKNKTSKNTYIAYSCTTRFFIEALRSLKYDKMMSDNFSRAYAKKCLEWITKEREWSPHAFNKNLGYIRSVFAEIIEAEQAEINPFREIKNMKVVKSIANTPPTDEEMVLICNELRKENFGLYILYMIEYHSGIRPAEQVEIQIKQLDFNNKMILLKGEDTKSKKFREVPMLGNMYDLLLPYKDENPEYYLFGTPSKKGGWMSRNGWFKPNPFKIRDDSPTKEWKRIIKDGLGLDLNLYSGKHKGADDKREAGMSIKTICEIFGHSESKMTERYMRTLKLERFNEAKNIKMKTF
ncbi:hypothetical protein BAZ12_19210 [Elizabethkingia miricola]|uniref:tyrosine-type recombinase/integrase n=1 Tax=Elizabethkingia miricola TaxID=172045 RepID=UPI00099A9E7F|nr:tyrosine-type recombinase/integrase [Elizabethkingia miricola]OPC76139.1 hypothetical protein BAZ12_19210 [Elizabethkingia miricola]